MPTVNQLVRFGRVQLFAKTKAPALSLGVFASLTQRTSSYTVRACTAFLTTTPRSAWIPSRARITWCRSRVIRLHFISMVLAPRHRRTWSQSTTSLWCSRLTIAITSARLSLCSRDRIHNRSSFVIAFFEAKKVRISDNGGIYPCTELAFLFGKFSRWVTSRVVAGETVDHSFSWP